VRFSRYGADVVVAFKHDTILKHHARWGACHSRKFCDPEAATNCMTNNLVG
jgi:hypothetical protein